MKVAITSDGMEESDTVNDSHRPNMCSSLLFASQQTSVMTDIFRRTRCVNELNNSSSRLLCSYSLKLLQNYANHLVSTTKEHSNNIHQHLSFMVQRKDLHENFPSTLT